jgi:hypothetical protein
MRDLLADSRFDIIRLRFRSSTGDTSPLGFGSSEPELEFKWFGFRPRSGSSEPELEMTGLGEWKASGSHAGDRIKASEPELEKTGSGDWMDGKNSGQSHGVKPASKAENGFPNMVSTGKGTRYADNMGSECC